MFQIALNESIRSRLSKLEQDTSILNDRKEVQSFLKGGKIPMNALLEYYNEYWKSEIKLRELITPLNFEFKTKYVPGSNYSPEFKKQLDLLSVQQRELEYQELIRKRQLNGLGKISEDDDITLAKLNKAVREQLTTVFNVLVSVASVVVAVWYWTGSSTNFALHYRVIACLFFGILVLIAEVVVYGSYLNKVEDARIRERTKKETKKVVQKIVI